MINFLVEVAQRFEAPVLPTPSNSREVEGVKITRQDNVYEINIYTPPKSSYWTEWGGEYDNLVGTQVDLYYSRFLTKANTIEEMKTEPYSMYLSDDFFVFMNIPNHPWLFPDHSAEGENTIPFLYSALDPDNPSNNTIRDVIAPVRLELPNLNIKLSDNINGVILNQAFSVSLHNNDGFFDDEVLWNLFNTPVYLRKAFVKNPKYKDFKIIRSGLVENTTIDFSNIRIDISDKYRAMDNPVCEIIKAANYPGLLIDDKALNKNIPVVYGRMKVKLQKLNDTAYLAAEYISDIIGVYDSDGNALAHWFNSATKVITSSDNADTAVIIGYPKNKISEIIKDLATRKAGIGSGGTNWNVPEYERYNEMSYSLNIAIESRDVKNAIQKVLKSDMAFFIQQSSGRFTIRRYGTRYAEHRIPSWAITKRPKKTWGTAQENYFSSCIINYDFEDDIFKSLLFSDMENEAEGIYRRRVRKTFDTDLSNAEEARELAETLSKRYTSMKQTLKLSVGIDTSEYELLDWIICDNNINDRKFSGGEYFIIKEINPAQDMLTLEELDIVDLTGEYADTTQYHYDVDNLYADTQNEVYEYLFDGGGQ